MHQKMTFAGIASLTLAVAIATPSYAVAHHRGHHRMTHQSSQSTPAERQQTAELNRQQLAQVQANTGSMGMNVGSTSAGTATQQNGLTTEPTSYRRPSNPGANNSDTGSVGTQPDEMPTPGTGSPGAVLQSNPSGTTTPPPANPTGGNQ